MKSLKAESTNIYFIHFAASLTLAFVFSLLVLLLGLNMHYIAATVFASLAIIAFNISPVFYHKSKSQKKKDAIDMQETASQINTK